MINILSDIKNKVKGRGLNTNGQTGELSPSDHDLLQTLFESITCEKDFPKELLIQKVNNLTRSKSGYLEEFRFAIKILSQISNVKFKKDFKELLNEQVDSILKAVLRQYPSRYNNSSWRLKSRITSDNIDLVLSTEDGKRIRNFVLRELLIIFYRSKWGWNVVDYFEYPSHILLDEEKVEVEKVDFINGSYYI